MTGGADGSRQFCRMCGREDPYDGAFCTACGARRPVDPVLEVQSDTLHTPPPDPAAKEEAVAAMVEFMQRKGMRDFLTGRSGGDVLSLDEADLLSGEAGSQADADDEQE